MVGAVVVVAAVVVAAVVAGTRKAVICRPLQPVPGAFSWTLVRLHPRDGLRPVWRACRRVHVAFDSVPRIVGLQRSTF